MSRGLFARGRFLEGQQSFHREFGDTYDYFSKYAWFSRPDVAHEGFASYFYHSSIEEKLQAKKLVDYPSLRSTSKPTEFANISALNKHRGVVVIFVMIILMNDNTHL